MHGSIVSRAVCTRLAGVFAVAALIGMIGPTGCLGGDMLCEHDLCFYACSSDADCAETMSCEHGNTVCEYP